MKIQNGSYLHEVKKFYLLYLSDFSTKLINIFSEHV